MEYFDRIVSLGMDCSVAGSLRNIKYKESTYIFDWNVTTLDYIIETFENNFENIEGVFDQCEMCKTAGGKSALKYENKCYFYHDSTDSKVVQQKYTNRCEKLKTLLSDTKKILFVRKAENDSVNAITKLKHIIRSKYPKLNFKILLINNIQSDHSNDDFVMHKYEEKRECFLKCTNDIYDHMNMKVSYDCVYKELQKFQSEKFAQPADRND